MPPLLASGLRALTAAVVLAAVLAMRGGLDRLRLTRAAARRLRTAGSAASRARPGPRDHRRGRRCSLRPDRAPDRRRPPLGRLLPHAGGRPARRPDSRRCAGGLRRCCPPHRRQRHRRRRPHVDLADGDRCQRGVGIRILAPPSLQLPRDPFVVVVYEMLVGGAVLTAVGLGRGEHFDPVAYSARSWAAWTFLVLVGSVLAFSAYAWLLQTTAVSVVVTYAYVSPVVAVFLGWLVLSEPVTLGDAPRCRHRGQRGRVGGGRRTSALPRARRGSPSRSADDRADRTGARAQRLPAPPRRGGRPPARGDRHRRGLWHRRADRRGGRPRGSGRSHRHRPLGVISGDRTRPGAGRPDQRVLRRRRRPDPPAGHRPGRRDHQPLRPDVLRRADRRLRQPRALAASRRPTRGAGVAAAGTQPLDPRDQPRAHR